MKSGEASDILTPALKIPEEVEESPLSKYAPAKV